MNWCGNAAASLDENVARELVDWHDRCKTQQTAKLDRIAHLFTYDWDDTHRSSLLVDHTDSCFVGNNARNRRSWGIAWDSNHIQAYGTYTGHGFQLLDGQCASQNGVDHTLIFAHRDMTPPFFT